MIVELLGKEISNNRVFTIEEVDNMLKECLRRIAKRDEDEAWFVQQLVTEFETASPEEKLERKQALKEVRVVLKEVFGE